ncbi:MAG: hypothetical protein M3250_05730, partial [Thermoproteota archaeon]|nr:hypothetical protein [Thermoproteota archaeon]
MIRDKYSNGNSSAATATTTAARNNTIKSSQNSADSNLNTLLEFKKTLVEEQKMGGIKIQELNDKIEDT